MSTIEVISKSLSKVIAKQLDYNEEKKEVITYGIFGLLHTLWTIVLVLLAGYLTKLFVPVVVILIASSLLRTFSGGAHCTSPNRCAIGGVIIFVLLAFLAKLVTSFTSVFLYYLYVILCSIFTITVIIKYCPVDSPNKPIKHIDTKKKLRRRAFIIIMLSLFAVCFLNFFAYNYISQDFHLINIALVTGLTWQSFTLLPTGHKFINMLDSVLKYIIN